MVFRVQTFIASYQIIAILILVLENECCVQFAVLMQSRMCQRILSSFHVFFGENLLLLHSDASYTALFLLSYRIFYDRFVVGDFLLI